MAETAPPGTVITIYGSRRSGKTTWAKSIIKNFLSTNSTKKPKVLCRNADYNEDWSNEENIDVEIIQPDSIQKILNDHLEQVQIYLDSLDSLYRRLLSIKK